MEAARVPGREADVAPAPAAAETAGRAGWTPADPGPLGLAAFAGTTFVLSLVNSAWSALISCPVADCCR